MRETFLAGVGWFSGGFLASGSAWPVWGLGILMMAGSFGAWLLARR